MSQLLHTARMRLWHFARARYYRGYGVHSPSVFHVVREVIGARRCESVTPSGVARLRRQLSADTRQLTARQMGAVSTPPMRRRVCDIYRRTSCGDRQGRLLTRLVSDLNPSAVLELGTSLGVSAAYLAAGLQGGRVVTLEGVAEIADVAGEHLAWAGVDNVTIMTGDIDERLDEALLMLPERRVQLAYVDANHSREATWRYFNRLAERAERPALLIFDDIFWSAGMTGAWRDIAADHRVTQAIELPSMGLAYLRDGCQKEFYRVRW